MNFSLGSTFPAFHDAFILKIDTLETTEKVKPLGFKRQFSYSKNAYCIYVDNFQIYDKIIADFINKHPL